MQMLVLDAQVRDSKISPKYLRKNRLIPAVYYGKGEQGIPLQLEYQAFRKLFNATGMTQVFDLVIDGKKKPVLVHDLQYHPLTDEFYHVDLLHVNLKVAVTAHVPVVTEGVAPAVKNFGGNLTLVRHEIEVKCLPMDIPHEITIDVSKLEQIGDSVHAKDLNLGDKVEIFLDPEEMLVTVNAPRAVEEELSTEIPEELKAEPTAEAQAEGEKAKSEE